MSTIDITDTYIRNKCDLLMQIQDIFIKNHIQSTHYIHNKIASIVNMYKLEAVNILHDYFTKTESFTNDKLRNIYEQYNQFLLKENIIEEFKLIENTYKILLHQVDNKEILDIITSLLRKLKTIYIQPVDIQSNIKHQCECGGAFVECICNKCGIINGLNIEIYEDTTNERHSRHSSYEHMKQYRQWIERIQARESFEFDNKIIEQIKQQIIQNNIRSNRQITCTLLRKYLSKTKNSSLNDHIPLLRKIITGISPPQFTIIELQIMMLFFKKVIKIFDDIKPPEKVNCLYYPYFIYKIIEQVLPRSSSRYREILACIHLQSRDTLIENDKIWRCICKSIKEFRYIPTNRNDQYIDY